MTIESRRLLGFAFAGADLLLEIDPGGCISLALGASQAVANRNAATLSDQVFGSIFSPVDAPLAFAVITGLKDGERKGPMVLRLAGDGERAVSMTAHRMAGNGGCVSVLMSRAAWPETDTATDGLLSTAGFQSLAGEIIEGARRSGEPLEVAFVEFAGLDDALRALDGEAADALISAVAGAVRSESLGGATAARVTAERFAVLRQASEGPEVLAAKLSNLSTQADGPPASALSLSVDPAMGLQRIGKALRFALEDFEQGGLMSPPAASLTDALKRAVRNTLSRAGEVGKTILERRFDLAYQPVVRLADSKVHHHEVLVRFNDGKSPFETIRLAEEFDLIEELDKAILDKVAEVLRADREAKHRLAVNVSGRTIGSEGYVEHLMSLLAEPKLKGRVHVEITESAAIQDMDRANSIIQAIRKQGSLVCLDDFGAGAASLTYLQKLHVDIVKIDGRYIRDLGANERDAEMVGHLAKLCREMKVRTVAEMVENQACADIVRQAGVDFAQGYLYGQPTDRPLPPLIAKPTASRRMGAVESWG